MEGKGNISDYRSKLDRTLASPDLTNDQTLQTLVKNQILQSSHLQLEEHVENAVEIRSKEVSNFLSMLRSTSENDVEGSKSNEKSHGSWKLKHDTEEFRVMYREGPEGAPYHTLLVEGYVDGPLDVCLCISWESSLYNKWWPQTAIPTFKVVSSKCLQRVRNGEQISLVRMKVSWPLSSREALIHYFVFEYFQDDLLVVLLNSISDSENIDRSTHGFTREGIPAAEEVVRIDVVGGFALQKVSADRSYFRTIANMDIKLDFVPPAFINFVSRQLIGSGFKLYKKEVASVSKGDEKFHDALKDPLYTRVREALYSRNANTSCMLGDNNVEDSNCCDDAITDSEEEEVTVRDKNAPNEIEENSVQGSGSLDNFTGKSSNYSNDRSVVKFRDHDDEFVIGTEGEEALRTSNGRKKVPISPKVEQALETLEKAISIFREKNNINLTDLVKEDVEESISSESADQMSRKNGSCAEFSRIGSQELSSLGPRISSENHASRHKGSNSYTRETNQSKIVPASPEEDLPNLKTGSPAFKENGDKVTKRKNKRSRFCCFPFHFCLVRSCTGLCPAGVLI